ncbi:MAG: hypothetical protein ABFD58_02500 [Anaerolineaceae bacterium]
MGSIPIVGSSCRLANGINQGRVALCNPFRELTTVREEKQGRLP